MEFKQKIRVLLLVSTILAEMYFQNREVEILRFQDGFIADETIDMLSGNIEYRDSDMILTSTDKEAFRKSNGYRKRRQDNVLCELNASGPRFDTRNEKHLADLRGYNLDGETAIHLAAAKGQIEVVRYLLEIRQDANIRTRDVQSNSSTMYRDTRQTPLHYAAAYGSVEVMRVLVEYGADISAKTESEDTALHKAALYGHTPAVRWLLGHGADLEAKNVFGATPLSMALVNQRKEVAVVLLGLSKSKDALPFGAPWLNEVQSCPMLLLLEAFMILMFRVLNSSFQVLYYPSITT